MKSYGELPKRYSIQKGWIKPVDVRRRYLDKDGYVIIVVKEHYIVGNARMGEHRLVLIEKLGRPLVRGEVAHHAKNKRRTFNHPDNIELIGAGDHTAIHNAEREVSKETREKMSKSRMGNQNLLGHVHSKKTKRLMSKSHKGHKPSFTGKHSKKTLEKMRRSQKERWRDRRRAEANL